MTAGIAIVLLLAASGIAIASDTLVPEPVTELPAPIDLFDKHPPWPVRAQFAKPTLRYPHGILGRIPGWGALIIDIQLCQKCDTAYRQVRIDLPEDRVFEDTAPRLWDITGDGRPEIVVVESDVELGARLTVWEARIETGSDLPAVALLAATPFIGTRFRWLAPLGAADFTGDRGAEIAYVERPHLDRVLRLVTLHGERLVEVAHLAGVTNHTIGEESIHGGIRQCGQGSEIIALSPDLQTVLAVVFKEGSLVPRPIGLAVDSGIPERFLTCSE